MKIYNLLCLLAIAILAGCSPKTDTRQWYKGNLHTHSYWSDGDEFPEMIMDWYKSHEYDFVALTDHNILAEGEKWIVVRRGRVYDDAFARYLSKFGEEWVTYKRDTGRVQVRLKTFEEYRTLFEDKNFLIIQSEEISDQFQGRPIHMNATNVQTLIPPQGGNSVTDVMQRNVDAVLEQRRRTGVPIMPHINHPNFHFAITASDMIGLTGERFFEVYNGHPQVYNYGDSTRPGTEEMWDEINIAYHRKGQPYLYGLATDDTHNYHLFGSQYSNAGRGWVMVRADSLTASSLIAAMERGDFYATTGVILDNLRTQKRTLRVDVKEEPGVTYRIEFIGATPGDSRSRILKTVSGPVGEFEADENYIFVRARVVSDKTKENPFQQGDYEMAWTQPVRLDR